MKADFKRESESKAQLANCAKNPGEFSVPLQGVGGVVKEEMLKKLFPANLPFEIRNNHHQQYNAYCDFSSSIQPIETAVDALARSFVTLLKEKGVGVIVIFYDYEVFAGGDEEVNDEQGSEDEWEDYEVEKAWNGVAAQRVQKARVVYPAGDSIGENCPDGGLSGENFEDGSVERTWDCDLVARPSDFTKLKKLLKKYASNNTHCRGQSVVTTFSTCQISVNLYSALNEVSVSQDEIEEAFMNEAVKSWGRQDISAKQTCVFFEKEGEVRNC
ncbi:hypothetical protein TL16_g06170 [Triparma laevis f. inornata]|uniref:Uncharacterized protein n=1 Tax=Triparma laevis f. inornata TaxID=1714386 RepID=A0A9W7ALR5_9STRA|nr:hypothetical protein TL16_g06170 [Triparma laevis f. inornata]